MNASLGLVGAILAGGRRADRLLRLAVGGPALLLLAVFGVSGCATTSPCPPSSTLATGAGTAAGVASGVATGLLWPIGLIGEAVELLVSGSQQAACRPASPPAAQPPIEEVPVKPTGQ